MIHLIKKLFYSKMFYDQTFQGRSIDISINIGINIGDSSPVITCYRIKNQILSITHPYCSVRREWMVCDCQRFDNKLRLKINVLTGVKYNCEMIPPVTAPAFLSFYRQVNNENPA